MGVKVATTCLQWSRPALPRSPSQPRASAVSSPASKRQSSNDGAVVCGNVSGINRSVLFGTQSTKLFRSQSYEVLKSRAKMIRRASSASLDAFSDEEFSKKIQELALRFQLSDDDDDCSSTDSVAESLPDVISDSLIDYQKSLKCSKFSPQEPPDWRERELVIPASIEQKANSVGLPLSLRIIKKKKQWQKGLREAKESAYSSVKKAFSSMVFIIRELQRYTLQMRDISYDELEGILSRVQNELNASFVWLFQQVFSHTPTLMMSVMILLANYSVYSMASNTAIAAPPPQPPAMMESVSILEDHSAGRPLKFDASALKTYSVSSSSGKTASINGGGGGKSRPTASGTAGDGRFDGSVSEYRRTVFPDGPTASGQETMEEEQTLWNSIVEEASRMQSAYRDAALDQETMRSFVSSVTAKIEADEYEDFFRTELLYQSELAHEPENALLLANYAQFLYLVAHDYDRAEEQFKKATAAEPKDAEALNKYACFLWQARNDLWAAEETYLEAISADPSNPYYAANYANFLWNTGGEDTCFL